MTAVTTPEPADNNAEARSAGDRDAGSKEPAGLSQFIAKVLDQLSLTSWLPAAMLVGVGALLLELNRQHNFDIVAAVADLARNALGTIIILLFAVVLAAVITQAFSFETIRFLEGYWSGHGIAGRVLRWRVGVHSKRRDRLVKRIEGNRLVAFERARSAMSAVKLEPHYITVLEDDFYEVDDDNRRRQSPEVEEAARGMGWRVHASPGDLDALGRAVLRLDEYPASHRILPTRLGNVIRAKEDKIARDGHDLEGLVMRRYERVPDRLMRQHDQFRDRLDMYCTFVPVFLLLAIASAALFATKSHDYIAAGGVALVFLVLAWVSYRAAIASARGYGTALLAIAERPATQPSASPA